MTHDIVSLPNSGPPSTKKAIGSDPLPYHRFNWIFAYAEATTYHVLCLK